MCDQVDFFLKFFNDKLASTGAVTRLLIKQQQCIWNQPSVQTYSPSIGFSLA